MALSHDDIRQMVWDEARRQGVDPTLATKLAWQESRFKADARSPAGAIGTMQLMPGTAKDLGVDPTDVVQNIRGGITYLKQQLARFGGRPDLALAAYNAGPGAVQKHGGIPPYRETQQYVQAILGDQAPSTGPTPRPAGLDWGAELGFMARTPEPGQTARTADGAESPTMEVGAGTADWAALVMGDTVPPTEGGQGQGQDWARLLFG